jgi:rod shape-determining protein MreD
MNKSLPTVLALLAAVILQTSIVPYLAILGVVPNVLFLVVVTLALTEGPVAGSAAGFVAGLLIDLLGTGAVGPSALVLSVVGYGVGMLQANMFAEGWLLPVTAVLIAGLVTEVSHGVVLAILQPTGSFWRMLFTVMIPGALYNTALAVLVYPWLARLLRPDRTMKSFRRLA